MSNISLPLRLLATAVFLVRALAGSADTATPGPISAERPGYMSTADIVPQGTIQVESGFLVSVHRAAGGASHEIGGPYPLIRIAFADYAELRWTADGFTSRREFAGGREQRYRGGSDFAMGVKLRLRQDGKYTPAVAVAASMSAPTGNPAFTSGGRDPMINLWWSKSLPRGFGLGGGMDFRWNTAAGGEREQGFNLNLGKELGHGFHAAGEVYRVSPIADDEPVHLVADANISKLLGTRLQLDVQFDHTVIAQTAWWSVGVGIAVRFTAGQAPRKKIRTTP